MTKLEILKDSQFTTRIASGAALVEFSSPTCAPCRKIEPLLEKLADEFAGKVSFLKVNVNECPITTARFHIRSVPTLLFIRDGNVEAQLVGAVAPQAILERLRALAAARS